MRIVQTAAPLAVSIRLFGPLQVRGGTTVLGARDLGGGKPRQVLEILALNAGTTVTKSRLVEMLWPNRQPATALATLESYLSVLRLHLTLVCDAPAELVRTTAGGYRLDPDRGDVDIVRFAQLAAASQTAASDVAQDMLAEAIGLADAPLLVDEVDCGWADEARRAQERRTAEAVLRAARVARSRGDIDAAVDFAGRAIASDPLNEAAWAIKLTALESAGRHAQALAEYGVCRQLFECEVGCAPGPALQAIFRRLLDGTIQGDDDIAVLLEALLEVRAHLHNARPVAQDDVAVLHAGRVPLRVLEACQVLEDLVACVLGEPGSAAATSHRSTLGIV